LIHAVNRKSKKTLENRVSSKTNDWRELDGSIGRTGLERDYHEVGKGITLALLGTTWWFFSVLAAAFGARC